MSKVLTSHFETSHFETSHFENSHFETSHFETVSHFETFHFDTGFFQNFLKKHVSLKNFCEPKNFVEKNFFLAESFSRAFSNAPKLLGESMENLADESAKNAEKSEWFYSANFKDQEIIFTRSKDLYMNQHFHGPFPSFDMAKRAAMLESYFILQDAWGFRLKIAGITEENSK